jgi:hypothetical protein
MRDYRRRRCVSMLAAMLWIVGHVPATAQDPSAVERSTLENAPAAASVPPPAAPAPSGGAEISTSPVYTPPEGSPAAGLDPPVVTIEWRVQNPFRFFKNASDTEIHRATWLSVDAAKQAGPVLAAEQALSARHPEGWAATMIDDLCWLPSRNRYDCGDGAAYVAPEKHTVLLKLSGVEDQRVDCTWLTAPLGRSSQRGQSLRQKCSEEASLDIPYPSGARVTVEIGGREVAGTDVKVIDLLVAAMGDSFGSGEGNPDVPVRFSPERTASYDSKDVRLTGLPARVGPWKRIGDAAFNKEGARWVDTACHRSLYSHQLRAALQLAVEDPHRAVTFVGLSCSGAEVTWGLFLRYKGNEWVPNPPDLSQISALADAQCGREPADLIDMPEAYHINGTIPELRGGLVLKKCRREMARKIDLLLVSIGGNDIGFARLVANAVLSDDSTVRQLGGWFGQIHGNMESKALLDRLDERYKALNRAIHGILHMPWQEADRVILTAYPPLAVMHLPGRKRRNGRHQRFFPERETRQSGLRPRRSASARYGAQRTDAWLVFCNRPPQCLCRARHLCGLYRQCVFDCRGFESASQGRRAVGTVLARRLPCLCFTPALVPYTQRCVHDGELPCRRFGGHACARVPEPRATSGASRGDILGRLPPDGGRPRRYSRCRGGSGAGSPEEVWSAIDGVDLALRAVTTVARGSVGQASHDPDKGGKRRSEDGKIAEKENDTGHGV